MLSPDDTHVFVLVAERPAGARNVIVPNYVNETGYTEDIPGRTAVGDAQNRALLAILNLKTGKTAWADGSFAPPVDEPPPGTASGRRAGRRACPSSERPGKKAEREIRWSMPDVSDDGKLAVAAARVRRQQGPLVRRARRRDRQDPRRRHAARRRVDPRGGRRLRIVRRRVPARQPPRVVPVRARRLDAPLHAGRRRRVGEGEAADVRQVGDHERVARARRQEVLHHEHRGASRASGTSTRVPLDGGARTKITSMTGSNDAEVSPDESTLGLVYSYSTKPPEVFVMAEHARRRGDAGHDDADGRMARRSTGSIRRSSRSRRATASTSTRGSSRRR